MLAKIMKQLCKRLKVILGIQVYSCNVVSSVFCSTHNLIYAY